MISDIETSVAGLLAGNHRILAKTITLIESSLPDHQTASQ
ncbi:MAG: methylmalonyl Co-A mutase-associated GTPase MeaB, partial [Deltaproteobacteria bacterium]|nr:methylmalonyl Co-A mutase-associated GTPase MeaB [Deltaproteobacteria bacterium]